MRFPSAFCGIYGFKPTTNRMTRRGSAPPRKIRYNAFNHIYSVVGPMGSSVEDLIIGMRVQCDTDINLYDPLTTPSPFREDEMLQVYNEPERVKIGILRENNFL
jgi:Asp-tRNA(Asn)/Glu-tRNA(Gln) amidotransferase A subunit family amidase